MRRYETIFISDPDLSAEDRDALFARLKDMLPQHGGFLIVLDEWGIQKLAYEIRKKPRGHYVRMEYCGTGALVAELERSCRIDDRVLKYLTVLLEKEADVETLKAELAGKEEAKADKAEEKTPEPEAASQEEGPEADDASSDGDDDSEPEPGDAEAPPETKEQEEEE